MAKKQKTLTSRGTAGLPGYAINIGISDKDRAAISDGLGRMLADTYTLYLTTHNFHWNVTGPMFNTLHAMFMTQYTELWNAIDPIAERIRSLGHPVAGSYAQLGALTTLPDGLSPSPCCRPAAVHRRTCWRALALPEDAASTAGSR